MIDEKFKINNINKLLDKFVLENKKFGLDYVDGILYYSKEYNIDILDIVDVLDENIKEMLRKNFIQRKMMVDDGKNKELPEFLFKF